ncbi:MAG TPA: family 78 glycoside hydrolase catalytic domain [Verrucomicrobiae bacterium]|nr:family 78 glycoside hydrolase catalytic domain [Verrucomicrobiae bacterium]
MKPKVFSFTAFFLLFCCQIRAAVFATHLRCEYAVNPLGIDEPHPRLFWTLESKERGQWQSAYQILVASSPDLLAKDDGDLWDTGKVNSDETTHIHYAGKELKSSQPVFWKVRSWPARRKPGEGGNKDDKPSPWSAPATWTMGLLHPTDWQAKWICSHGATETLLLRKEFDVRPGLVRGIVHISGLGQYEMTLNGVKAGDDLLSPGWTDYDKTTLYDTKDVTSLLHKGRNTVGLTLGNGMYNVVRRNRFVKFTGSFGPLRAICQLQLEYADGSIQIVATDQSWRTHAGPIIFSNIYGGEDYDGRLNPTSWEEPGFDDSAWRPAVEFVLPPGKLRGQSAAAPPLRAIEVRRPVEVRPLANGDVLFDLGQNAPYMPRLRVTGPTGSTVRLMPGEIINADGTVNQKTMGAGSRGNFWWEYTKGTDREETWFPKFCYMGCRYMQAHLASGKSDGELPHVESLEGVIVHSSATPIGDFSCSNELLNRIRTLVRWAQRANMVSVLTDCPHREKLGWLEQYHLNGPAIRYEFDVTRIFAKGMNDMADAQLEDGLVPNIAPEYTQFKGTFRAAAEWGSACIIVPWQQYQFDGDIDLLRDWYDLMKRYFAYLESRAADDIVSEGLGDWYDLGPKKPGAAQLTPPPVTATAFYYHDAQLLSRIAAVLGRPDEAKNYAARAERIRASYNRHFFNRDKGAYATGSQCANALPLVFDIVEPAGRARVFTVLVRDVEAHGNTTGDVGFRFLLRALARGGRSDLIYKMINQDDKPGYGYQLKKGATSLCESWDANNTSSHDHFMLGQITEWFYKDLAGIHTDLTGPGFKKIIINPQPVDNLKWAKASYDSIRGTIVSNWKHDGDKFTLNVTIPANTTATVFVPTKSFSPVTEGGKPAKQSVGVKFLREENDHAVFSIESGEYSFESRF